MSRRPVAAVRRLGMECLEARLAMATFYVSNSGNDTATGAVDAPWQTLQKAANSVQAGDTVIVRAGNYVGFDLRRDGTAASRITFSAEAGAVINQRNAVTADGINLEGADYVTIEGFTVIGMPRTGIRSVTNQHVIIRNNTLDQNYKWGILTGFSYDLLIENNVTTRSTDEHGIYVSNSGDRPTIRNNTIWGNRGNGIHMNGDVSMGGDGIISGALVEGNVIYNNGVGGGSGINGDGVQNSVIRNNLLYGNHASGISLYRIDGGGGSSGNLVVNNTVVQASDGRWALNIQNGSTGNTVRNNILYNNHSFRGSIDISADSLAGFTSDYNVLMNRLTTNGGNSILTLASWQSLTGQDLHSIVATPSQLFVNPAANDYHLLDTSPAVDAGTSTSAPPTDLEGNARPSGAGFDIGAYERQVASQNGAPVAVNDSASTSAGVSLSVAVLGNDSDPDGDTLSIASFTQAANGSVQLVSGQLRYTPGAGFSGSDTFTYVASDGLLNSNVATVTVTVAAPPANEAPTGVGLSSSSVRENAANGTVVGTLSASDPNAGDTHTFTLVNSAGGRFAIAGNQVVVSGPIDYEAATSHQIVVRATDAGGLSHDQTLTVGVQNVNELVGIDVQRGRTQRSYIRHVDLIFESSTGLQQLISEGRVELRRFNLSGDNPVNVALGGKMQVVGNRIAIDFGSQGIGGNRNSATGNGYYRLLVDADDNGSFEAQQHFYRLLGDANGDRIVDQADLTFVRDSIGQSGNNLEADVNGDGVVNNRDRDIVRKQLGRALAAGLPVDD